MSLWIEIHCDVRAQAPAEWAKVHPCDIFCHSDANVGPGDLFENGATNAKGAVQILGYKAKIIGWVYTRKHGWACPNCKTTL